MKLIEQFDNVLINTNWKKVRLIAIVVLVVFVAIFPLIANRYFQGIMIDIAKYSMIALGLNLLMGYAGQISLGHAGFFGLGAYITAVLAVKTGMNPWISSSIAIIATGGIAYIIAIPTLKLKGHYLAIATLGFGIIIYIFLSELSWLTGEAEGISNIPKFSIGSFEFKHKTVQYYFTFLILILLFIFSNNLVNSRIGRALKSIHSNEIASKAMGVDTSGYKRTIFTISAIFAAIAGCLHAHFDSFMGYTTFSYHSSIKFVIIVVFGGMATIWGALFGAGILRVIEEQLQNLRHGMYELLKVDFQIEVIFDGLILILVIMFLPNGVTKGILDYFKSFIDKKKRGLKGRKTG